MSTFDWDEHRRRERVRQNGSERSEFTDITEEIAKAKGRARYKGKWSVPCPKCGAYVSETERNIHIGICKGAVSQPKKRSLYDARPKKRRHRSNNKQQHPEPANPIQIKPVKVEKVDHHTRFHEWALRSAGVAELSFDGKSVLCVRLQPHRYISVRQAQNVAEYLASEYATRTNLKYASCFIYCEDTLYAKGRYWKKNASGK